MNTQKASMKTVYPTTNVLQGMKMSKLHDNNIKISISNKMAQNASKLRNASLNQ